MRPHKVHHVHMFGLITRSWCVWSKLDFFVTPRLVFLQVGHWQWCLHYRRWR